MTVFTVLRFIVHSIKRTLTILRVLFIPISSYFWLVVAKCALFSHKHTLSMSNLVINQLTIEGSSKFGVSHFYIIILIISTELVIFVVNLHTIEQLNIENGLSRVIPL